MIEKNQDLFYQINDSLTITCITTNGIVKQDGRAVMGAGIAKLIRDRYIDSDLILGSLIKEHGNIVQRFYLTPFLVSFPTKNDWREKSDLNLIESSAKQLFKWSNSKNHKKFTSIILPRPGCHNGGLLWEDVKPILEKILIDDKFIIIHRE